MKAVEAVFLQNKAEPLKIGSIKSNMGHSEPASGLCSITKVILSFESGILLPNINFSTPRTDIEILNNGKLNVSIIHRLAENTKVVQIVITHTLGKIEK